MPWVLSGVAILSWAVGYAIAWLVGADRALLASRTCDAVVPPGTAPPACPTMLPPGHYRVVDPAITLVVGIVVFIVLLAGWRLLLRRSPRLAPASMARWFQ